MRCPQAKTLISLYVGPEPSWLRARDRQALETHLAACAACRRDWQESREALGLLQEYWQISADTQALLQRNHQPGRHGVGSRIIPLPTCRRVAAGAVAAALVLAVLGAWTVFPRKPSLIGPDRRGVLAGAYRPLAIVSSDGDHFVPGTRIGTAAGEARRLVLNARHQIVMRGDTSLSCEPLAENGRTGCLVHLARGEIFARVEHDGNPFLVQTALGRAVITGTTFDIRVGRDGTTLAVIEGSVRFESAAGHVQVVAAQSATITAASSAPSVPAWCDADALTAWIKPDQSTVQAAQDTSPDDFTLDGLFAALSARVEVQTELDAIDYRQWVEQKRDWFRRQFPWIFALQEALASEGIEADYPTLLWQSGDIWRFTCPQQDWGRSMEADPNSLVRAAACYGRDESWLKQKALLAPGATGRPEQTAGLAAFARWAETVDAGLETHLVQMDSRVLLASTDACVYLANTRTLASLMVYNGHAGVTPQVKYAVAALHHEELQTLAQLMEIAHQMILAVPTAGACEYSEKAARLVDGIRKLGELEARMSVIAPEGPPPEGVLERGGVAPLQG